MLQLGEEKMHRKFRNHNPDLTNNNIFIRTIKAQSIERNKKNLKHEKTNKRVHVNYSVHRQSSIQELSPV